MIENVPGYISITFILTTFLTIGFLFIAIKQKAQNSFPAKLIILFIGFWIFFTAILGIGGFYQNTQGIPPRFILLPVPPLLFIGFIFIFFRESFVEKLPLKILTLLQIVRIPVEIVLFWLYQNGLIPQLMTFEGRNPDILAGLSAPFIFWLAFRGGKENKTLLLIWNIICLLLVTNIVTNAVLSLPSSFQQFAFEQPNRAVLFFPYVWLPGIIVPIVYFFPFCFNLATFKKTKPINNFTRIIFRYSILEPDNYQILSY